MYTMEEKTKAQTPKLPQDTRITARHCTWCGEDYHITSEWSDNLHCCKECHLEAKQHHDD